LEFSSRNSSQFLGPCTSGQSRVGDALGLVLGDVVGLALGLALGLSLGLAVGVVVGVVVGLTVTPLGLEVGLAVRSTCTKHLALLVPLPWLGLAKVEEWNR
jgi:hypothetical protein